MYDIVFNLQEWLGRSSSLQPSLVADSAEQSLLPFHPSQQRQDGPSESHTSAATQSQQPEGCSSSSPHDAGLYHRVVSSYGVSF